MAGKQAKTLTDANLKRLLAQVTASRYPERDRVMILLSIKAGLRACEISGLTWAMAFDANRRLAKSLEVRDVISKRRRGRTVPLNRLLRASLAELQRVSKPQPEDPIVLSERGGHMCPMAVVNWFGRQYQKAELDGCSSHSGRRTFITNAARLVHRVGGSLRDVQQLAGHASISMTQRYIEGHTPAKAALVNLL